MQAQVAEQVKNTLPAGSKPLPLPPQLLLMRTSRANLPGVLAYANPSEQISTAPFTQIEVRIVPENVTTVGRSAKTSESTQMEERLVTVRHGETVESALSEAGLTKDEIANVAGAFGPGHVVAAVPEGARLKLLIVDVDGSGSNMTLARLSVYSGDTLESTIAINDRGAYVRVTPPHHAAKRQNEEESDESDDSGALRLYDSFYETALKQEIPRPIIDELVRIFANDIDFHRGVSAGDSFEVL